LVSEDRKPKIERYGELAGLPNPDKEPKSNPQTNAAGVQITMIAGSGFIQDPAITVWV